MKSNQIKTSVSIGSKLEQQLASLDPTELICHAKILTNFGPQEGHNSYSSLREYPLCMFAGGLALKVKIPSKQQPSIYESGKFLSDLEEYFSALSRERFKLDSEAQEGPEDTILENVKQLNLIGQINSGRYPHQEKVYCTNFLDVFKEEFKSRCGLTPSEAIHLNEQVVSLLEDRVNNRKNKSKKMKEDLRLIFEDKEAKEEFLDGKEIPENLGDEELIQRLCINFALTNTRALMQLKPSDFDIENIETDRIAKYFNILSCNYGDLNNYSTPYDPNPLLEKPFIKLDEGYYTPSLHRAQNLPLIFEKLLSKEKFANSELWQSFQTKRGEFCEELVQSYFRRIFPPSSVRSNCRFRYNKKDRESDVIILYDRAIFLIEVKSGNFSDRARYGDLERIKYDLDKLIKHAFDQAKIASDYIQSNPATNFRSNGNTFTIRRDDYDNIFFINVTLDDLLLFATDQHYMKAINLLDQHEYAISMSIFDLDIVTEHIPTPGILLHYLSNRAKKGIEKFHSMDEPTFLSYYMHKGNFRSESIDPDSAKEPDWIQLDPSHLDVFESYYLFDGPKPEFKINRFTLDIILSLESIKAEGYSKMISALLDLTEAERCFISEKFEVIYEMTLSDSSPHDISFQFKPGGIGFSLITLPDRSELRERLITYCHFKKYQTKSNIWFGMGRDISDSGWPINEFVYLNAKWEEDNDLSKLTEKHFGSNTIE